MPLPPKTVDQIENVPETTEPDSGGEQDTAPHKESSAGYWDPTGDSDATGDVPSGGYGPQIPDSDLDLINPLVPIDEDPETMKPDYSEILDSLGGIYLIKNFRTDCLDQNLLKPDSQNKDIFVEYLWMKFVYATNEEGRDTGINLPGPGLQPSAPSGTTSQQSLKLEIVPNAPDPIVENGNQTIAKEKFINPDSQIESSEIYPFQTENQPSKEAGIIHNTALDSPRIEHSTTEKKKIKKKFGSSGGTLEGSINEVLREIIENFSTSYLVMRNSFIRAKTPNKLTINNFKSM